MSEFKRYQEKAAVVEALKITVDTNTATVQRISRQEDVYIVGNNAFRIAVEYGAMLAYTGDWLVRDESGSLFVYGDEAFQAMFEAAE